MTVKFHGKKLQGEATVSQRALLAKLEGKTNYGQKISKANASIRIDQLLAVSKKVTNGKAKALKPVGDATVRQRALLARLEGKVNYGQKISFEQAQKRLAKLLKK